MATEIRRLHTTGTNHPIHTHEQPLDRRGDTTYFNPRLKEKMKDGKLHYRVRGTIGGDRIHIMDNVSARTADLEVLKLLGNSVLADNARWMTADITDFYLNHPLPRPEYYRLPVKYLSDELIAELGYAPYIKDGHILMEVNKTMYGLPQAGIISQQHLVAHLADHAYHQDKIVPCLFRHASNGVTFCLTVDDFGVKYFKRADAEHLMTTLKLKYAITEDWSGSTYLGIGMDFNHSAGTLSLSMPGYVTKALQRFHHTCTRPVTSPMVYTPPHYGQRGPQSITPEDHDATPLSPEQITRSQEIIGTFLYYARAVDPTMLTAVTALASDISKPTTTLLRGLTRLLDYAATFPDNKLVYRRSNMILTVHSDASYLSRSRSRSVVGGIGYLGPDNGAIFTISTILDVIVASAAEAEYGALFVIAQHAEWTRTILAALGHPQPATTIISDNKCAVGLANDTLKIKRSKSIDMRFHWLRDRISQGHFKTSWEPGSSNRADFFTKALPCHVHQARMAQLVNTPSTSYRAKARQYSLTAYLARCH
jgi:hypothetical protein